MGLSRKPMKGDHDKVNTIIISVGNISMKAQIHDTPTGQAILAALPIASTANVWGDEIYFDIPVELALEPDARDIVALGDLAYWPTGSAFCIFFGPTPASQGNEPRAFSPVNVFGKISGDPNVFRQVENGAVVKIEAA